MILPILSEKFRILIFKIANIIKKILILSSGDNVGKKYIVEFDREGCIGAAACVAVCPDNWEMQDDGKPNLLRREIDEDELEQNKQAAEACPVNVIKIFDKETGDQII